MRAFLLSLLIVTGLWFIQTPARGQVGITTMSFLEVSTHARSMGMAGATVAMPNNDAGMHLNPAVFGVPGQIEITTQADLRLNNPSFVMGTHWLPAIESGPVYHMPSVSISGDKWSVGYQYTYLNLGSGEYGRGLGREPISYRKFERAHTVSVAYRFSPYLSAGISRNFIKSQLAALYIDREENLRMFKASTKTWDVGLYGGYPFRYGDDIKVTPSMGWSLTDYGGDAVSYSPIARFDPLPVTMRAGFGLRLVFLEGQDVPVWLSGNTPWSVGLYRGFGKVLARPGILDSWDALTQSWETYTREVNGEIRRLTPADQIRHQYGMEVSAYETFSLRYGYHWEHKWNGDRKFHTLGVGIAYKWFTLDYVRYEAADQGNLLDNTSYLQITFGVPTEMLLELF